MASVYANDERGYIAKKKVYQEVHYLYILIK